MNKEVKYTIRMPEDIHYEIEKKAKENRRSLNNEMLIIFEEFIKEANKDLINKELTEEESALLGEIKKLPLEERKSFLSKLLILSDGE